MSLVTVDELSSYMSNVAFTDEQTAAAQNVLAGVQSQLERYVNRDLEPTLHQERVQADSDGKIRFTKTPVVNLISIIDQYGNEIPVHQSSGVDSDTPTVPALTGTEYETYDATRQVDAVGGTFFGSDVIGYGTFGDNWFGPALIPGYWYVVKYVSLMLENLDDVRLGILRVAAREMVRDHDDTVSIKDGVIRDDPNPSITGIVGFGFTKDELHQYDRLKRRVIV